jgi:ABC-type multidrug transport system permease subunit
MARFGAVIRKSWREQMRSFWLLLLTISTAPFFVLVYDLITESYTPSYEVVLVNNDRGTAAGERQNLGDSLVQTLLNRSTAGWKARQVPDREQAVRLLKDGKADMAVILPQDFSEVLTALRHGDMHRQFNLAFTGNMADMSYLIASMVTYSEVSAWVTGVTGISPVFNFTETPLGTSGQITDFEAAVPGLVIFAIIMLMLTASVAMVAEVENRTMMRLTLSGVGTWRLMGGITVVQVLVGFLSVLATLITASLVGFRFHGAFLPVFVIVLLTTISIIAFSLFIAAFSKSVTQVLIIGNFPLFLFMFFTGAMFPIHVKPWFTVGGYPVSVIGLMSPTHAVTALQKLLIMQEGWSAVVPEMTALSLLCILYFALGTRVYRLRHMKEG